MKKVLLLFTFFYILLASHLSAQYYTNQNKIWTFGFNAGLNFDSGYPISISSSIFTMEGCASISDAGGNLLFYTEGANVYNRLNVLMPHGAGFAVGNSSTTQGAVIVPVLNNPNQYYIFSLQGYAMGDGIMEYSIIDMTLDSGFGDVSSSTPVVLGTLFSEKMIAIPGNNCDVWLIVHRQDTAEFFAYDITPSGINSPVISYVGTLSGPGCYAIGVIKASPNRSKIVSVSSDVAAGTEIYDFNPSNGVVSDCQLLDSTNQAYGADFSPDGKKLYVDEVYPSPRVVQYNIALSTIALIDSSKTMIDTALVPFSASCRDLKLAPDGKIYIPTLTSTMEQYLDCINYPDSAGDSCNYVSNAILLNYGSGFLGLPNLNVNATSAIGGVRSLCVGDTLKLLDSLSGGIWSCSNSAIASIDPSTGLVTAVSVGVDTVFYTIGGCSSSTFIKVVSSPAPIAGGGLVCDGYTQILADVNGGGFWSCSNTSIALVGSNSGIVTGVSVGTSIITYTLGTGCYSIKPISVISGISPITGPATICQYTTALFSDTTPGGVWQISTYETIDSSGLVTGENYGSPVITYAIGPPIASGCVANFTLSVNITPAVAPIVCTTNVCAGSTAYLYDATAGGVWSCSDSDATAVLYILTGISPGNDTIMYSVTIGMCTTTVYFPVSIQATPNPIISGLDNVCVGFNDTLISSIAGGSWSASNGNASINDSGVVTGVSPGQDTIAYYAANPCGDTTVTYQISVLSSVQCDSLLGINNIEKSDGQLIISPNPTFDKLSVKYSTAHAIKQIIITSLLGQTVYCNEYNAPQIDVDVTGLSPGVYFVKVNGVDVRKFVKD